MLRGAVGTGTPGFPALTVQAGLPFIFPPNGTMANNGAVTLNVGLPYVVPNGYMFMPSGAIAAGSAAGWYFCQMSANTVGTLFNNVYTTGPPIIPPSPTAFATVGPGAYTGSNGTGIAMQRITIPGGTLGVNSMLFAYAMFNGVGAGSSKSGLIQTVTGPNLLATTQPVGNGVGTAGVYLMNRNSITQQILSPSSGPFASGSGFTAGQQNPNINFGVAQDIATFVSGPITPATDNMICEMFWVQVFS